MKLLIAAIIIFLSLALAHIRASELKKNKYDSSLLLKLSEKIRDNLSTEMCSVYKLSEAFFANESGEKEVFSSTDDMVNYINDKYKFLPLIKEFIAAISKLPSLPMDELPVYTEKLIKAAEKSAKMCDDKFIKEGKNAYIIYPGIVTVLVLILI